MSADQMRRAAKMIAHTGMIGTKETAALLRVIAERADAINDSLPTGYDDVLSRAITGWDEACRVAAAHLGEEPQP